MINKYDTLYEINILKEINKRKHKENTIIPIFNNFFKFIKNYNILYDDKYIITLTNILHRILYFVEDSEKDYKFLYKEFLNIVDYGTSSIFENILESFKILLERNNNLSIEPLIKELEITSNYFNDHYLNDRIKIIIYKISFYLDDYLSINDKKRLENLLFKTCSTEKDTLKSYRSSLANYLYALNINGFNIIEHEKIILKEGNTDIISSFGKDILDKEIKKITRKR